MYCVHCGNSLEDGVAFCKSCGAKVFSVDEVATKFCSNCGTKIPQTANFCSNCGIKQDNSKAVKKDSSNQPDPILLLKLFYKNAFRYNGKINRRDFWITFFLNFIISCFFNGAWYFVYAWGSEPASVINRDNLFIFVFLILILISIIWIIWTFFSNISIDIRRLHDINRSGFWILLVFLPFVGPIVLIIMYLQPTKISQF